MEAKLGCVSKNEVEFRLNANDKTSRLNRDVTVEVFKISISFEYRKENKYIFTERYFFSLM